MAQRSNIKTTKEQMIEFWETKIKQEDIGISWQEAKERCWRCGHKGDLQRCHIVPDSLGGKDAPENLVLLCKKCHAEAPNVQDNAIMWDWIKAYHTFFYDTYWTDRQLEEYERIYHVPYLEELRNRDILSYRDLDTFMKMQVTNKIKHFGQGYPNLSTEAGELRLRLLQFDEKYRRTQKKSDKIRQKEKKFEGLVDEICVLAKQYHWSVQEGKTKNPFSVTISAYISRNIRSILSVKLVKNNVYKACYTDEVNPNCNKAKDYTIELGSSHTDVIHFIEKEMKRFTNQYGRPQEAEYITYNPLWGKKNTK